MADTKKSISAALQLLIRDMRLTVIDGDVPRQLPKGVHPHVIGCWIRKLEDIEKLFEKS